MGEKEKKKKREEKREKGRKREIGVKNPFFWGWKISLMNHGGHHIGIRCKKTNILLSRLREVTHKKSVFLLVGPLRFNPPYTNGLVVPAIFFFSLKIDWNRFWQFFIFLPKFWANTSGFIKKSGFLLSGQGGLPSLHP